MDAIFGPGENDLLRDRGESLYPAKEGMARERSGSGLSRSMPSGQRVYDQIVTGLRREHPFPDTPAGVEKDDDGRITSILVANKKGLTAFRQVQRCKRLQRSAVTMSIKSSNLSNT